ncbi:aminopeptidase N-like [Daphnia pulex]|uniref:aminopeptidase N-like n=1 Tax=Daphnia pulex TaxID=6669 RepID=UPI001EDF480F|nr:aminopeptidase N-like [Daphnia pulex]
MQATEARRVLSCLDEPGFKTTFDVVVGHSNAMTALSNMPEISSRAMATTRDWMWTSFSRSPPMPTYLLAMFVTDYESLETIYKLEGDRSVKLRFWGRPDQLPYLKESMAVAGDLLNYLVKYVRQSFTLPKIDFITSPIQLHFEAMENWGLILFREIRLYHNKETDSEDDRFTLNGARVGASVFRQFQSVNSQNFMEILNEQLHQDHEFGRTVNVTKIMNSWTHQPNAVSVTPKQFITGQFALWWIPIAMTDGRRPDFNQEGTYPRVWLTPERPTLEIPYFPQIFVNGQFASYGRVLYGKANWRLIYNQLVLNHTVILKVTRAQLIDDAFTLALVGYLDYQVVVELIEYLTLVNDEFVQSTSLFHLKLIQERSRHNESLYNLFKEYTNRFKFEKTDHGEPGDHGDWIRFGDPLDGVGCLNWSDDGVCVDQVMRLFHAQMDGSITPEEKKAMTENLERNWCAVIRYDGKEEWNWAWRASLCDMWSSQRTKILSAMSCSQDRDRLKQLLSRVFSSTIEQDPHGTFATIEKMTENHVARSMVFNFLATNWEILGRQEHI